MIGGRGAANGPRTHALVIGVGDYPYLENGDLYRGTAEIGGLRQLTSPPVSANAFASWLAAKLANRDAPIGSVRVVLSDGAFAAGFKAIANQFDSWLEDCNTHSDNVAIFYFCGHGFNYEGTQLLLAEDFGESPNRSLENAIDFRTTWLGMHRCMANSQLYILDCCREIPFDSLRLEAKPRELLSANGVLKRRDARIIYSAPLGKKAFGDAKSASTFTTQLLRCLEGFAADRPDSGIWKVTTESLARSVGRAMEFQHSPDADFSANGGDSNFETDIHELNQAKVFARVSCLPPEALGRGTFTFHNSTISYERIPPFSAPWELEMQQGNYDLAASFDPHLGYRSKTDSVQVNPPYFSHKLTVL